MRKIKLQKVHLHDAKPLSRTELKNVFGGNTPTSPGGGDKDCVLNWIKCPGQGLARVGTAQQGLVCC
ncbi:hypothetical protein [Chryseobacterium sp. T20]|uniref:hypothetical protein n=1 Tax=Chryseobacterium sp. T20 TaxID=3395375 RepID=UPI0039BD26C9